MTPQERQLVAELFERLQKLENAPRDPDAVDAINQGLDVAPNALYPLVQTVLVQDEALKRADARIRELEAELGIDQPQAQPQGGFLDSMRDALLGRSEPRGSVPSVRTGGQNPWGPAYGQPQGAPMQAPRPQQPYDQMPRDAGGGGSFLGTAAASAAGVIGGALLLNSFRDMFGGPQQGQSHSAFDQPSGGSPWSGGNAANSDLARDAGFDDVGRGTRSSDSGYGERAGLFDVAQNDAEAADYDDTDFGGDFDGGADV